MTNRKISFSPNEWFHCFNRGIDRRLIFNRNEDRERFLQLLYICNSTQNIHRSDFLLRQTKEILALPRKNPIVSIGSYCLMSNHYHLLLKEIIDGGITQFMRKLGTAYTMYFNKKYERTGNLLTKPFRARHIGEDRYFQRVVDYIHCNPAELIEPGWKNGTVHNIDNLEKKLLKYRYSSFPDYNRIKRDTRAIISGDGFDVYRSRTPREILEDAKEYYAEIKMDDPE